MPHLYNERVFLALDVSSPLLQSYGKLVAIELALKRHDNGNWSNGHKLDLMLASLGKPALTALSQALRSVLTGLWCEKRGGGPINVSPNSFPEIRYLRHASDFQGVTEASSDDDLERLKNAVDDLATELKKQGILA